jgi:hypothetical protein
MTTPTPNRSNDDANKKRVEEIKNRLAEEKSAREKQHAEHRNAMAGVKPTPTQHENDQFTLAVSSNSLPHTVAHQMDGSPIQPDNSYDVTPPTPTWLDPP